MVSKIRFGYEGKFYDAFDVTFYDEEINSAITRRVADVRLEKALFDPYGDYVDKTAQHIDEGISYYLSDEEVKKSLEDIECIVYCVYHNKKYMGNCQYKASDGTIQKYQSYNPY